MHRFARAASVALPLLLCVGAGPSSAADAWPQIESLLLENRWPAAVDAAALEREAARRAGDEAGWMRALVQEAQLRVFLSGQPEGFRCLRRAPWPPGLHNRAILHLYAVAMLQAYARESSWSIQQREPIERPPGELDLESASRSEILDALLTEGLEAWAIREALSDVPLSGVYRYVVASRAPAEVRGTLRDAVSYRLAEVFADSTLWPATATRDLPRAELPALIQATAAASPADRTVHPLIRMAAVLGDLESWHAAAGRRAAALEARRERLRLLWSHFIAPEDRQLLIDGLEASPAADREDPWWAMGRATLADFIRQAGDLPRAWNIARAAAAVWPETPGGESCRRLAEEIEASYFTLTAMAGDGFDRRSLRVQHRNVAALRFRAWPVDVAARLRALPRPWSAPLFPSPQEAMAAGAPPVAWTVELPPTPDFEIHQTYVTPPIHLPGAWLVVATPFPEPEDPAEARRLVAATGIVLGDLVLTGRDEPASAVVAALSGATGEPLPGVEIQTFAWQGTAGAVPAERATTGPDGRARLAFPGNEERFVLARRGEEIAFLATRAGAEEEPADREGAMLFFTDRSVYRPGQTVFWKVIVYDQAVDGEPVLAPGRAVEVELLDPHGERVAAGSFTANAFGTAAGSFVLPAGRALGEWKLTGSLPGAAYVRVEEYKRPAFEVELEDPAEPLRLGGIATFSGTARTWFGLPVTGGRMRWRVVREPVWSAWRFPRPRILGEREIARGSEELDPQGRFRLSFLAAGEKEDAEDGATWRFRLEAEVTDEAGETREAVRHFRLGKAAVEASIGLAGEAGFLLAEAPGQVLVGRTSLDGAPLPGVGTWTLVALRQPEETVLPADQPLPAAETPAGFRTPGDALRPREGPGLAPDEVLAGWEEEGRIASGTSRHGADGRATISLPGLAAGAYRLRYSTIDGFGTPVEAEKVIVVAGPRLPLAVPLLLAAELPQVRAGGRILLLAHSGLRDQPLLLEIYRGGRLRERRRLRSDADSSLLAIPVLPEDRGGLRFRLTGVRDHQLLTETTFVFVPWDNHELAVELSTFRDKVRPGARETWSVSVRQPGPGGAAVAAAEVLASMYDRSLDLFAEHRPPDVFELFPYRMEDVWERTTLGPAPVLAAPFARRWTWSGAWRDRLRLRGEARGAAVPWYEFLATPATPEEALQLERHATFVTVTGEAPLLEERHVSTGAMAFRLAGETPQGVPPPPPPPPPPSAQEAASPLRRDFRETAFWEPRLLTGPDGTATIEFTVPDSVTSWTFWVQALTRDLRAGSLTRRVESVKDLMVRPRMPRFLREGDRAVLRVSVDNASAAPLSGTVALDVVDAESGESLLGAFGLTAAAARAPFSAAAGGGTTVSFPLTAARPAGPVAVRVTATAAGLQDGELRPLPILPARLSLAQSRFVGLREPGRREMSFAGLAEEDPTRIHEQLVVTVEARLFDGLLAALPYLVDHPYECTEQTVNRFVSTGILAGLFDRHPDVARKAAELARRDTPLATWEAVDPNRKMALEETPWLAESRGLRGREERPPLRVLDPRVARAEQETALERLQKAQLADGAFPWWPGGPASPYMTAYLLISLAKAHDFGAAVPEPIVRQGWAYLATWLSQEQKDNFERCACWRLATLVGYAAALAPSEWTARVTAGVRQDLLALSWRHRFEMSPLLQALLALTLHRLERTQEARTLLENLLATAQDSPDEGIFWSRGRQSWLWYEDEVETQAFVLRAVEEVLPGDPRRHGLVQWLFLHRQLNHWPSTRSTAEVLAAVALYLQNEQPPGVRDGATVRIGARPARAVAEDRQIVIPGAELRPEDTTIVVEQAAAAPLFATATWHFSTEVPPAQGEGDLFRLERRFFRRVHSDGGEVLEPLGDGDPVHLGDEVEIHLVLHSRVAAEFVHLRDPRHAGLEPGAALSGWRWGDGVGWYEETRDSGVSFFLEHLPAGTRVLKHRVRAAMAGTFQAGPATVQAMYAPEHVAYSAGQTLRVEQGDSR
ncbi:MAG TPA: hypothetical protein DD490_21180 [Acidobacteria bacterium]|nr:hypothetical protein [Acidobacteriota bacterium]